MNKSPRPSLLETTKARVPSHGFMLNSRVSALLLLAWMGGVLADAQPVSVGVVGGTNFTPDFRTLRFPFSFEGRNYVSQSKSEAGGLLVGASVEIGLRPGWSFEFEGIRRKLRYQDSSDFPGRPLFRGEVTTWQFPMLVKRRFSTPGGLYPFVAVGPSLRTVANPSGSRPKRYGATASTGIEIRTGPLVIAPALRFTRWAADNQEPFRPTIVNQLELLTSLRYRTETHGRVLAGKRVWLGVVAGFPLTKDLAPPPPDAPPYTGESRRFANFRSAAGVMVELPVSGKLSLEVDGLYRRLHFDNQPEVVVTWQVPVMAKYALRGHRWQPFLVGGPAFRISGNLNGVNPAKTGVTVGAGLTRNVGRTRLAPVLRYTRWSADGPPIVSEPPRTKRDQIELLVALSF